MYAVTAFTTAEVEAEQRKLRTNGKQALDDTLGCVLHRLRRILLVLARPFRAPPTFGFHLSPPIHKIFVRHKVISCHMYTLRM